MANLDYFLEDKIIMKNIAKLKGQLYRSVFPVTSKNKFRWTFDTNFVADRFCYDYLYAYKFDRIEDTKLYDDLKYLEIVALATANGRIEELDINLLVDKLKKLTSGGYKAVSYVDKLLLNLSEAYELISQRNFPLNQENFELFIHVLFRNLVYDLDIVDSYLRNEKTKTSIKNPIDNRLIVSELENFWRVFQQTEEDAPQSATYSGLTRAFMLALEIYYISPYDRFNLIIMTFIAKWYFFQLDDEFRSFYFNFMILADYKNFINTVEDALKTFNLDNFLQLMRHYSQQELNFAKRIEWLIEHIETHKKMRELKKYQNLFYLVFMMGFGDHHFSLSTVLKKTYKSSFKMNREIVEDKLQLFVSLGILEQDKKQDTYFISDAEFKKIALMFKD